MTTFKSKPHRAVGFKESAIKKSLDKAGSLDVEIKYDGVRVNLMIYPQPNKVPKADAWFWTRESKPLPSLEYLWKDAIDKERWDNFLWKAGYPLGVMIDGEAMVKGVDFNTSSGLLRTKWMKNKNVKYSTEPELLVRTKDKEQFKLHTDRLQVIIYAVVPMDVIETGQEGSMHAITRMRTEAILPLLQEHFPEIDWVLSHSTIVYSVDELNTLYQAVREDGHEGLVIKDPLGNYKRGKKSGMWKMKPEESIDGVVVGLNWGTEGLSNEGKVIGFKVLLENGTTVNANNISQELMNEFTHNVQLNRSLETAYDGKDGEYYHGYQVEVSYMELTPDGSLRHPSFKCFRGTEDNPTIKS